MGPLERVKARANAFDVLGVTRNSEPEEIRAAWRRVAFERHPDRCGGDQSAFVQAKAAYDFLMSDDAAAYSQDAVSTGADRAAEAAATPKADRRPPSPVQSERPTLEKRTVPIHVGVIAECERLLSRASKSEGEIEHAAHLRLHADAETDLTLGGTEHVAHAIEREGRRLTYLLADPLAAGVNCVALPTAVLEHTRRVRPQILLVSTRTGGAGEVRVPDTARKRVFPGAREVRLRFGVAQKVLQAAE